MSPGAYPTAHQADVVRQKREEWGPEDALSFAPRAYQGTDLAAYGLIEVVWTDPERRLLIHPSGECLLFEAVDL